jgi:hypothetical protein
MWERVEPRLREIADAFREQAAIAPEHFAG